MPAKVLIAAPFSTYSGYGNDGLGMVRAFIRRGWDVYLQPTHVSPPLPPEVAQLLTKEIKAPFDLFINHVDPSGLEMADELVPHIGVSVAWTMWEYNNYLNGSRKKSMRKRLKNFDLFSGYSDLDIDSFEPYFDGPLVALQGGFDPGFWQPQHRDWTSPEFHFFMIGVLSERKDPFVAIQAFRQAMSEDPEFNRWGRLSLKTTAPGLHHKIEDWFRQTDPETGEEYTNVRVYYDIWPTEIVRDFYAERHVLLAPSRGEGKNMPALEFMSTGGTVIATDWAGHRQWLSPEYSYPLEYELQPVDAEHPDTLNARASVENLKDLMLHAFHNRQEVRNKGEIASTVIPKMCSWDAVIDRLILTIKDKVPEKGERLWAADMFTQRENQDANS